MGYCRTEGYILTAVPFREGDRLARIYTRECGLLSCVAKGSRKLKSRTISCFEPLYKLNFLLYRSPNRDLLTVSQATPIESNAAVRDGIDRFGAASIVIEILLNFLEPDHPDNRLYRLLEHSVERLKAGDDPLVTARVFEFRFISLSGYQFEINHCVGCRSHIARPRWFSVEQGGMVCSSKCFEGERPLRVGEGAIRFMKRVFRDNLGDLRGFTFGDSVRLTLEKISRALHYHHTGKKLKSVEFYNQVLENGTFRR